MGLLLLSSAQMAAADRASISAGVPGIDLIEAAGMAVAHSVQRQWSKSSVLVLCGPGNNGGDGFVAASCLLEAGWQVRLVLLVSRSSLSGDAARSAARWTGHVEDFSPAILDHADVMIARATGDS